MWKLTRHSDGIHHKKFPKTGRNLKNGPVQDKIQEETPDTTRLPPRPGLAGRGCPAQTHGVGGELGVLT